MCIRDRPSEALGLLRLCKEHSKKVGLSFHVGSQCMHKISFSKGIAEIGKKIKKTKIVPDVINVGGGFPSIYPDLTPEPLENYLEEIKKSLKNLKLEKMPEIFCEPGGALVAESGSTIVKILLKKKQKLYINENLCSGTLDIYSVARKLKKKNLISSCWTFNGVVHIKKRESDHKGKKIFHLADFENHFTFYQLGWD